MIADFEGSSHLADSPSLLLDATLQQNRPMNRSDAFTQARHAKLKILEGVTETQLTRTAYLEGVGEITLDKLLELWIEHDRGHIRELKKLRAAKC